MHEPGDRTSPLLVALAWIVVAVPLAWGVYQTAVKSLPLFQAAGPEATGSRGSPAR